MRDADGGAGLVDVLAAGAAGAVSVDPDVVRVDDDIDILFNIRHDIAGDKGGLALALGVEGRNAHEAVNTALTLQVAVSVGAADLEINRFDARLVAVDIVHDVDLEALAVSPAGVHAVEHGAPVTALRAARAGVEGKDGIRVVVFACEQGRQPHLLQFVFESIEVFADRFDDGFVVFFIAHLDQHEDILILALNMLRVLYSGLQILELLHLFISGVGVRPEVRCLRLALQLLNTLLFVFEIQ